MPPHLRNQSGGSSQDGGNSSAERNSRPYSSSYGGRGYGGGDRRSDRGPPRSTNTRWNSIEADDGSRDNDSHAPGGGGYSGGYGGRGYNRGRGGGGGYRSGGGNYGSRGPRVNERGFHGDMRPDPRLERQLFQRDDVQTTGINFDNYDDIPVETTGNDIPEPIDTYSIDTIGEELMRNTELCGYSKPTPVQKYSVPIGNAGRDLMACAQTGSGYVTFQYFFLSIFEKYSYRVF